MNEVNGQVEVREGEGKMDAMRILCSAVKAITGMRKMAIRRAVSEHWQIGRGEE